MSLLFSKPGSWWFRSNKDPRWDCSGHVDVLIVTSGLDPDAVKALEDKKKVLGEELPDDLVYGCMKD